MGTYILIFCLLSSSLPPQVNYLHYTLATKAEAEAVCLESPNTSHIVLYGGNSPLYCVCRGYCSPGNKLLALRQQMEQKTAKKLYTRASMQFLLQQTSIH